ncbi:MAG: hypothetical protein HQM09_14595 [Candidatus Riflebacteria bacterium]|nr:hypothetical protein [Candidatus Riflebacteria bacterium]
MNSTSDWDLRPYYLILSLIVSGITLTYAVYRQPRPCLFSRNYRDFLFVQWKVVTFFCSATLLALVAPYTGDPTWDYFDAGFMAVLTYFTAPWAVGTLYRFVRGRESVFPMLFAIVCWMFSASWSYDLYLLIKQGQYPITWFANIGASSSLYLSAGLFWNLRWRESEGASFSFMHDVWPAKESDINTLRLLLWGLPFAIIFGGMIALFLISNHVFSAW